VQGQGADFGPPLSHVPHQIIDINFGESGPQVSASSVFVSATDPQKKYFSALTPISGRFSTPRHALAAQQSLASLTCAIDFSQFL
jgi:hypothetical protein